MSRRSRKKKYEGARKKSAIRRMPLVSEYIPRSTALDMIRRDSYRYETRRDLLPQRSWALRRLPILGLRSQRKLIGDPLVVSGNSLRNQVDELHSYYRVLSEPSVCRKRAVRQQVLFAKDVAGRRRSPGRGGTYRRTERSNETCSQK